MYKIVFENPQAMIPDREVKSKLLHPGSLLYSYLETLRELFVQKFPGEVAPKRMDYHIELSKGNEDEKIILKRAEFLHNKPIDISNLTMNRKSIVLDAPAVDGYGPTHITIAYFPEGAPSLGEVNKAVNDLADMLDRKN